MNNNFDTSATTKQSFCRHAEQLFEDHHCTYCKCNDSTRKEGPSSEDDKSSSSYMKMLLSPQDFCVKSFMLSVEMLTSWPTMKKIVIKAIISRDSLGPQSLFVTIVNFPYIKAK
ncbi:hypothetical protein LXL04_040164 [Taraxacum kok-saghyz]